MGEMKNKLACSVGVLAYNEASNIGNLLDALLSQELNLVEIKEIIVVSSASTDGTDDIVREMAANHKKISLITESERRGKSAAINKFIAASTTDLLIIESGDTIPAAETVEKMIIPYFDKSVGMTGGKPVPENPEKGFVGYCVNLLWRLHDRMARISPKLGEMVSFRKIFSSIPEKSAVDEASIEAIIRDADLKLKYIPEAVIHNKGPENMKDFISQRRRIASGHIWLEETEDYSVASQDKSILMKISWAEIKSRPGKVIFFIGAILLENYCRFLGWYDLKIKKKNPFKWDIAKSTKNLELRDK
jgi:poly-beta-1,6-N-acetyl-D-glucosamine synthase